MRRLLLVAALLLLPLSAMADAPAPASTPRPRPVAVLATPSPEPLDITPDAPTDPPAPQPVAPMITPSPKVVLVPMVVADEPPCGYDATPRACASVTSGAVSLVTRDGRHEYATAGVEVDVPYQGWTIYGTGDAWAVQDGAALDQGVTTPFRAVLAELGLSKNWGNIQVRAHGAVSFSVEGKAGAPVNPRQYDALATLDYLVDGGHVSLSGGYDGAVGGAAAGVDFELPVPGHTALVGKYQLPLYRDALGRLPWVVTVGARIKIASFRLHK